MKAKSPWVLILLGIAIAGSVWLYQKYRIAPSTPWNHSSLLRENKTELKITELSETKYILLDYFGTWCINCLEEIPELLRFQQDFEQELKIFLVHEEESETIERFRIQHPVLPEILSASAPFNQFGIHTYPTSYLIRTSDGSVVFSKAGQLSKQDWESIRKILNEAH